MRCVGTWYTFSFVVVLLAFGGVHGREGAPENIESW